MFAQTFLAVDTKNFAIWGLLSLSALVILLELILRKSEKLNLLDQSDNQNPQNAEATDGNDALKSAIDNACSQYGHLNSFHLQKVNFSESDFSFIDGWRATTDQPANSNGNVYIFGGSTIQCIEVTDSQTICSHLQRILNHAEIPLRVQNRGVSGMTVSANKVELAKTSLTANDWVIFYFGANDSKLDTYSQVAKKPFRWIPGYTSVLGLLRIKLKLRVAEWIWLETVKPADRTLENASKNATSAKSVLMEANEFVLKSGAKFLALLQPNVFTKKQYSTRDLEIHKRSKINPKIVKLQYNEYLQVLQGMAWFNHVTNALDDQVSTSYLDWCHLDSRGNELVAKSIFRLLESGNDEKNY